MSSRRQFVKGASLLGLGINWASLIPTVRLMGSNTEGVDWGHVRDLFPISTWEKIYLNSGSAGVMPTPVQDHLIELIKKVNSKAPYEVLGEWQEIKASNLSRLAEMTNCGHGELQIVRNTTEALNMIIYGLTLDNGDEVVMGQQDYPFAKNAWLNRAKRDDLIIKEVDLQIPAHDEEILAAYDKLITDKTEVVHITHITHREGHIMPVKKLTALAHSKGAQVVVDGAHSVANINLDLKDLDCDYFASSLHKWLNAPLGTGLLYVKEEKIKDLYNHPSSHLEAYDSINKFEHLGTRAWANEMGISAALDFHEALGHENKMNRLQELKEYWTGQLMDVDNFKLKTWIEPRYSRAVATFSLDNVSNGKILNSLNRDYNIHAKSVGGIGGGGIRVSPNVFTTEEELDQLVFAIRKLSQE